MQISKHFSYKVQTMSEHFLPNSLLSLPDISKSSRIYIYNLHIVSSDWISYVRQCSCIDYYISQIWGLLHILSEFNKTNCLIIRDSTNLRRTGEQCQKWCVTGNSWSSLITKEQKPNWNIFDMFIQNSWWRILALLVPQPLSGGHRNHLTISE